MLALLLFPHMDIHHCMYHILELVVVVLVLHMDIIHYMYHILFFSSTTHGHTLHPHFVFSSTSAVPVAPVVADVGHGHSPLQVPHFGVGGGGFGFSSSHGHKPLHVPHFGVGFVAFK